MAVLTWILLALFAAPAADLGHPLYRCREAATRLLTACWPLSEPALRRALAGECPETRRRAGFVLRLAPHTSPVAATLEPWRVRLAAAALVYWRFEDVDGLPHLPERYHERYAHDTAVKAAVLSLCREAYYLRPGECIGFECGWADQSRLHGIDDMRFRRFGLLEPYRWAGERVRFGAVLPCGAGHLPGHDEAVYWRPMRAEQARAWAARGRR